MYSKYESNNLDWRESMPFKTNISHMVNLDRTATKRAFHSNVHQPSPGNLPNLNLRYPGDREMQKMGDYKLDIAGFEPTHVHMVNALYSYAKEHNEKDIIDFLKDIFDNGLNGNATLPQNFSFGGTEYTHSELRIIIYWLVLQEDINFARPKRGIRLPFTRYIEACLAATHPNIVDINSVRINTDFKTKFPARPVDIPSLPYYQNILKHINK